jgi:hypothetical protein
MPARPHEHATLVGIPRLLDECAELRLRLEDGPRAHLSLDQGLGEARSPQRLPPGASENGFVIEGMAVFRSRVFLGLGGPIIDGWR